MVCLKVMEMTIAAKFELKLHGKMQCPGSFLSERMVLLPKSPKCHNSAKNFPRTKTKNFLETSQKFEDNKVPLEFGYLDCLCD